ncbi:MAG: Aldehyde oxidase and xanthine dehydrogenase molybdopterin binding, partial [Phycisphaerales bacterium]|nr:Aldehyde oxidase and xanthine dehydrogenase molybdopterin binding [Phycisphaerales bacterium]
EVYQVGSDAFGCKGAQWPHTVLTVALAKLVNRPVRMMLTRKQMFTCTGHRPSTNQTISIAADKDGSIRALDHETTIEGSVVGDFVEAAGKATSRVMYATPNLAITHRLNKINIAPPTFMRAPGECPGMFALECAMDELAVALKMDPVALRLKNYAEVHPEDERPWSGKHLKEVYQVGSDAFGWTKYDPTPGRMKTPDGRQMGWGVAGATYPAYRFPGTARIRLMKADDGGLRAIAAAATHDLGTGAYTAFTQIAATQVGLPADRVKFELGDSALPPGPVAGGSNSTASVGQALYDAGYQLKLALYKIAVKDQPGMAVVEPDQFEIEGNLLAFRNSNTHAEGKAHIRDLIDKSGRAYVEGHAGKPAEVGRTNQLNGVDFGTNMRTFACQSFGVHFVEVVIDRPAPMVRINRVVSVMDVGTVINPKTARSQIIGGVVMGLGMALTEETHLDSVTGRPATDNLADYAVAVNADVPQIDVHFIGRPDYNFNAIGCRGVGEIGITGIAAAVANAVYHATGKRVRDLPITPDKLL